MSLLDEISRLNEGFSPEELMRLPGQEGLARQDARLREIQTPDSKEIGSGFDDNFLNRIMQIESGGNPRARTGSYKGLFQLSDEEFNRYGGGDIYDPNDNRNAAIRKLSDEREKFRRQYGEEPSPTDLYMLHQQGEAGYAAHRANPNAPAWQNMASTGEGKQKGAGWARQAIWGNVPDDLKRQYGSVDNVTSADFVKMWRGKVEGGGNAAATFDPTGRTRMANGDQRGILGALGMQNQQPQGLLGALGDPETMAYIGMMLKGLSPYSNIDPNSMLSSAHTNALRKEALRQQMAERATDNQRADRALNLREQEYGLSRQDRDDRARALSEERQQKRDMAEAQRKADAAAFGDLTGRPTDTTAAPDAAAPFAPLSNDDKIAKIDQRLAQGGLSDAGEKQLLRLREQYSKPPSASVLKQITKDEDAIPVYDDIGRKLDRALELAPKVSTGLKATAETTFGPMLGDLAPQQTKDTINFRNITSQFAIENMSQTMKGATSDKEMFKNLSIAADERNDIGIRIEALKRAKERNDQLKEIVTNRKKQLEEGTYGRKQPAKSEQPSGGKTRLRFNPETGDFE